MNMNLTTSGNSSTGMKSKSPRRLSDDEVMAGYPLETSTSELHDANRKD